MTVRNLNALFAPRSVALIGASGRAGAIGRVLLDNLLSGGFAGPVMAVNPKGERIGEIEVARDVASLPETPDLAVIATPPETVPGLIAELGARGTRGAVVITAGFGEQGDEGRALQQRMLAAARPHLLRIVGPNCLGVMVPGIGLNAGFAHIAPAAGEIAFLSQSGAIVTAVIDWAADRGIGFSHMVSLGGMADVDFGDMLDYLARDPGTRSILLYVESITNARKFMSAGRAAARLKPVVVLKAGRHVAGARAAASHTGALAGSDVVYQAAFRRAGMLRVLGLEELFDAVEVLSAHPERRPLLGERLAILTNGGGAGVLATDFLEDEDGSLAELAPETIAALDQLLPATWSRANPVDIIGDAPGARYRGSMAALLADKNADAVLALNCPTAVADNVDAARAVVDAGKGSAKPIFTVWLGGAGARAARAVFEQADVPTFETPQQGVRAFMHRVRYQRNQRLLMEIPPSQAGQSMRDQTAARAPIERALREGREWLSEPEAKAVLAAYGVPIVETRTAASPAEAAVLASELGFPVALKIVSPDITHKSDVGGVALALDDAAAVRAAAAAMLVRLADQQPAARLAGFSVQPMAARPSAFELILGLVADDIFGPVVLFGHGGTAVEILDDKAMGLPPLNLVLAHDMIRRTRIFRLLQGYRDRPGADLDAVAAAIVTLGEMAADLPEIAELDINPLWADAHGILALDARIRVAPAGAGDPSRRFAIRPYPAELETVLTDRVGDRYQLRPIRPEDAPLYEALVAGVGPELARLRFFSPIARLPRQLVARLTQIDYDREMAFTALRTTPAGEPEIAGGVRLTADPDNERGEYAILVRPELHDRGLGTALMTHMIAYAKARGLGEVHGLVLRENDRMLRLCDQLGFTRHSVEHDPALIEVRLALR